MMEMFIFVTTLLYLVPQGTLYEDPPENMFLGEMNGGQGEESVLVLADLGTNHSLPCGQGGHDPLSQNRPVMWRRQAYGFAPNTIVQPDGSLFFNGLHESNSGLYSCQVEEDSYQNDEGGHGLVDHHPLHYNPKTWFQLKVRTPPFQLRNVTVLASTILASVMWEAGSDGGYPISSYHVRYRLKNESDQVWINSQPDLISPTERHWDVFHLLPKSPYIFEIWANNHLGKGVSTLVETETHNDLEEIQVGRYLLEGVDTFDTRVWLVAVGVVLGTLCLLGLATCCLLYKEYYYSVGTLPRSIDSTRRRQTLGLDGTGDLEEEIELIPNIIFNPVFDMGPDRSLAHHDNASTSQPINGNSLVYPTRV